MNRLKIVVILLFIFVVQLRKDSQVDATSWAVVSPEEVVNRSVVVVLGKYDFDSQKIAVENSLYTGVKFKVNKVYKGEDVGSEIVAGLDGFDFRWVDEFQMEGGEFILFLENRQSSFLTPVSGPNGMVQFNNERIIHPVEKRKQFFENYLLEIQKKEAVKKEPVKLSAVPEPVKPSFYQEFVLEHLLGRFDNWNYPVSWSVIWKMDF
jgi:hypothetical protein